MFIGSACYAIVYTTCVQCLGTTDCSCFMPIKGTASSLVRQRHGESDMERARADKRA